MRRLLVLALLPLLVAGCTAGSADDAAPSSYATAVYSVLDPCPQQPDDEARGAETLPDVALDCLGGGRLDLGRAPGIPTVVSLWASWCPPCREELPLMQQLADAGSGEVRVVGVISKDGVPQAESFASDAGATFPGAFDGEGRLMAELGLNTLPHTYFLDAEGALVHTETGPVDSLDELEGLVAEHLGVRL